MSKSEIIKVGFDAERMKYNHTGLYHFCSHLGKHIVKNIYSDVKKIDLSFYLPKAEMGHFGNDVHYIAQNSLHKFWMSFASKFDVWHSTFQGTSYFPFHSKASKILTIHDLNFLHEKSDKQKHQKYLAQLQKKIDHADRITAISNFVKQEVEQNIELKGKQIQVIYNGCNIQQNVESVKPKINSLAPFIFSIGTIARRKNFHVLPALLLHNDFELIIAGIWQDVSYKDEIMANAKKLGVENRVHLVGTITENEKYWYLQNCLAFAFPSLAEGFGLPVIEAMYFGKPVFLSKATSLPEIGSDSAFYFQSFEADAMHRVFSEGLNDYMQNGSMRQQIMNRANYFNWDNTAKQYINLYKAVADS